MIDIFKNFKNKNKNKIKYVWKWNEGTEEYERFTLDELPVEKRKLEKYDVLKEYYKHYPDKFIEDMFGENIKLYWYQRVLVRYWCRKKV